MLDICVWGRRRRGEGTGTSDYILLQEESGLDLEMHTNINFHLLKNQTRGRGRLYRKKGEKKNK